MVANNRPPVMQPKTVTSPLKCRVYNNREEGSNEQ